MKETLYCWSAIPLLSQIHVQLVMDDIAGQ